MPDRWFRWNEMGENEQPIVIEASETEILKTYFPHWCDLMRQAGKGDQITHEHCIEDFCTVHWAWDATDAPRLEDADA